MASAARWRSHALSALVIAPAIALAGALCACATASHGRSPSGTFSLQNRYESVIRKVLPSVVEITAGDITGSGVVFDRHGHVVTNLHVVGNHEQLKVYVSASSKPMKAHVVGTFAPDDLAVIKVNTGASSLKPARWANSARVPDGAVVLAMGNPFGLSDSVTQGIVSATGRTVTGPAIKGQQPTVIADAIQTSAAINPGNSGGALVMLSGQVVGIPTLSATDPDLGTPADGIGFAIPSDTVTTIARQLISNGKVTDSGRASLGISGSDFANPQHEASGVSVRAISSGGAADKAGIRPGDVIVGLGGRQTMTLNELEVELSDYRPGQEVKVEVLRAGNPRELLVTLGSLSS
jgi:putative serine protease PepD